jgi:hypothetical protein
MTTERTDDPLIGQTEKAKGSSREARAANLFDVRRLIGGLFAIYGVILTILGIGASEAEKRKAAGINLNLWVGIGMLIVAALFLLWAFTRPLANELGEGEDADGADADASETTSGRAGSDGNGTAGSRAAGRKEP